MSRFLLRTAVVWVLTAGLSLAAPAQEPGQARLQWLGHSAVKITTASGKVILIDPFISSNPATPEQYQDLSALGRVDLILVTHAHSDHWGDTAEIAKMTGAPVAVNADFGSTLLALGVLPLQQIISFNKSGSIKPIGDDITITMTHAEHSSAFVYDPPKGDAGVYPGGAPVGYIIELGNGYTIWDMGDTGVFAGMGWIARYYHPDLVLMPIGGHYTMDPEHAAFATRAFLRGGTVIPLHYGTFASLSGTPKAFKKALGDTNVTVVVMQPGETRPLP